MRAKGKMTLYSLIWCLLLNGILTAGLFLAARETLHGIDQWLIPLLRGSGTELSEEAKLALNNLNQFLVPIRTYLAPAILGTGGIFTLFLWLFVQGTGRSLIGKASASVPAGQAGRGRSESAPVPAAPPAPQHPYHTSAVQILSILQRQGRLLDFLQEDLSHYEDSQIGAAVRNVHQDCQAALSEYVRLAPVFAQEEGSEVTVAKGFDATSIRLTGNVSGEPPFRGVLRHRGWRVERVELPQITSQAGEEQIVAPAEVEVSE